MATDPVEIGDSKLLILACNGGPDMDYITFLIEHFFTCLKISISGMLT
jgi:hypothetical protein